MFGMKSKCEKKGHKFIAKAVRVRMKSTKPREVCVDHRAIIGICDRCGERATLQLGEKIADYQSVSMPVSMWEEMNKHGYLIVSKP